MITFTLFGAMQNLSIVTKLKKWGLFMNFDLENMELDNISHNFL